MVGSRNILSKLPQLGLQIGNESIVPAKSVRNIGVIFDQHMNMKEHIITTCKSANYQLYQISRVRKYLTKDACISLIHAFVTSKLDYGNALLFGVHDYLLKKLQKIQNTAARIVCRLPKFCHITPVLYDLHWLPVKKRIEFKILLTTFKALHGKAPEYITELIQVYNPPRALRSSQKQLLKEPRTRCATLGDRAFSKVAPGLWNNLPEDIKAFDQGCSYEHNLSTFKKKLKEHLFHQTFSSNL